MYCTIVQLTVKPSMQPWSMQRMRLLFSQLLFCVFGECKKNLQMYLMLKTFVNFSFGIFRILHLTQSQGTPYSKYSKFVSEGEREKKRRGCYNLAELLAARRPELENVHDSEREEPLRNLQRSPSSRFAMRTKTTSISLFGRMYFTTFFEDVVMLPAEPCFLQESFNGSPSFAKLVCREPSQGRLASP